MGRLIDFLKEIFKSISGYQIQRGGGRGRSIIALTQNNIEVHPLYPEGLLLMDNSNSEVEGARHIYKYLQSLRTKTILEDYAVNLVLDVGANEGQFALNLRNLGYEGKIMSFEPLSTVFQILSRRAVKDPNWNTYNLALGKQSGKQKIQVSDSSVFSSFLKSNSWCEQRFGKESVGSKEETVTIRRLEEVLNETIESLDEARIFLKMDTQGYDLEVFAGLGHLLKTVVALQSEVSVIPIYENMPHLTESISCFEKAGFDLAGMYPVVDEISTLRVVEFDCLMVKAQPSQAT